MIHHTITCRLKGWDKGGREGQILDKKWRVSLSTCTFLHLDVWRQNTRQVGRLLRLQVTYKRSDGSICDLIAEFVNVSDHRISSVRFTLNVTQWIEFSSDDNFDLSKTLILEDLRQIQDDSSIHTTQMVSYKKRVWISGTQRRCDECVCSTVEAKSISSLVQVTRSCERHVTWSLFKNNNVNMDKKNRRHRKAGWRISSIYNVLMEITGLGVVRSSGTNVISLTQNNLFVNIWATHKSIWYC